MRVYSESDANSCGFHLSATAFSETSDAELVSHVCFRGGGYVDTLREELLASIKL